MFESAQSTFVQINWFQFEMENRNYLFQILLSQECTYCLLKTHKSDKSVRSIVSGIPKLTNR